MIISQTKERTKPSNRILVVEDDEAVRQLYSAALKSVGYQIDTAEDGEAGWKMLHGGECDFDLLITDNNMPKLSGAELIEKVRAAGLALPIIMVSGTLPEGCDKAKLAALLTKPVPLQLLVKTVKEVLNVFKADRR